MEMEQRETLLVIVGAGASHDVLPARRATDDLGGVPLLPTVPLAQARPPLTQGLAAARPLTNWVLGRWPWAQPAIDYLRHVLPSAEKREPREGTLTLERALAEYERDAGLVPERRRAILAVRFYLRDLLWACTDYMLAPALAGGITNYLSLLNTLLAWCQRGRCVVFVSFNYDLILEHAMRATWDFNPSDIGSCLAHDRVHLLKPHGSIQWNWLVNGGGNSKVFGEDTQELGERSIERAMEDGVDESNILCTTRPPHHRPMTSIGEPPMVPAIALPTEGKADFVWPPTQRDRVETLQGTVTRVLTIGWRGLEPHFLPLLTPMVRQDAKVLIVSGGDRADTEAGRTLEALRPFVQVQPQAWKLCFDGFSKLVAGQGAPELGWLLG